MHNIQRVRTNLYAALSGTALSQAIAGVAQVMIVRTLGVDGYGRYTLLYAWLAIVAAVMGAGLDMWLLDSVSRQPNLLRRSLLPFAGRFTRKPDRPVCMVADSDLCAVVLNVARRGSECPPFGQRARGFRSPRFPYPEPVPRFAVGATVLYPLCRLESTGTVPTECWVG